MNLDVPRPSRAYLDFIQGLKYATRNETVSALRQRYETRIREIGVTPETHEEVADVMAGEVLWSHYGIVSRLSQEMMWQEIGRIIDRNRATIDEQLRAGAEPAAGTLQLDPNLELPKYYTAVEFHLRPGGMWRGDTQGLLTDLADRIYGRGENDDHRAQRWVASQIPDPQSFQNPMRVLDLGCGIGKATWPLAERFPAAELHGCDLSAPLLTFMYHVAGQRGVPVHLKQANAEATGYPDAWFDVVEAYILFHELPDAAARAVIAEVYRILKPGGIFALADIRSYARMGPFGAFLSDWQTRNNGEAYWRAHCLRDYPAWLSGAGLTPLRAEDSPVNRNSMLYLASKPGPSPVS